MALFSRKRPDPTPAQAYNPVGRKLESRTTLQQVDAIFRGLAADESSLPDQGGIFFDPVWDDDTVEAPDLLVGARLTRDETLYMAAWDRGDRIEIHVVPPGYEPPGIDATRHFPIFGLWKQQDQSLTSVGGVMSFPVRTP